MKKYLLLAFFSVMTNFVSGQTTGKEKMYNQISKQEIKAILDSFNIIRELNVNADGINAEATELQKRCYRAFSNLFYLPYNELEKLSKDKQPIVRFNAESIMIKKFNDSFSHFTIETINDTSHFSFFVRDRLVVDPDMTIGLLAQEYEEANKQEIIENSYKAIVIDSITNFIKQYSKYPSSFKLIDSKNYNTNDFLGNIIYSITLEYQILNNKEKLVKVVNKFNLNPKFQIVIIGNENDDIMFSSPPNYGNWFIKYGRELIPFEKKKLMIDN